MHRVYPINGFVLAVSIFDGPIIKIEKAFT